jgi:hypothetical protein
MPTPEKSAYRNVAFGALERVATFRKTTYQAQFFASLNPVEKHQLDFSNYVGFKLRSKAFYFFVVWIDSM